MLIIKNPYSLPVYAQKKKKGTRFVYISWSVNCLKILALKEFLKSNFSYLKAFSQTQGDLFSTVRHATLC